MNYLTNSNPISPEMKHFETLSPTNFNPQDTVGIKSNNITIVALEKMTSTSLSIDKVITDLELESARHLIRTHDMDGFDALIKQMKCSGNQFKLVTLIDKLLTPTILKNAQGDRNAYHMILQAFAKNYPKFDEYFVKIKDAGKGAGFAIFTEKALALIFDHLKEKGTFKGIDFAQCKGVTYPEDAYELQNELLPSKFLIRSISNMLENPNAHQKCAFLITAVAGRRHVIPIFIERTKEGVFRCLVSDSVSRSDWVDHALREVRIAFNLAGVSSSSYEIYNYMGFPRQLNAADCAVFSIRDLAVMAINSNHIFDWIKKYGEIESKNFDDIEYARYDQTNKKSMPYYNVRYLPPKMMSMAQSMEKLKTEYCSQKRFPDEAISQHMPSKKSHKKETLEGNLSKHTFERNVSYLEDDQEYFKKKEFNLKAEHFFLQYEKIILLKLITGNL